MLSSSARGGWLRAECGTPWRKNFIPPLAQCSRIEVFEKLHEERVEHPVDQLGPVPSALRNWVGTLFSFLIVNGQNWNQLGLDIDCEAADDGFGVVSMNATGDRVAIGASWNDGINGINTLQ